MDQRLARRSWDQGFGNREQVGSSKDCTSDKVVDCNTAWEDTYAWVVVGEPFLFSVSPTNTIHTRWSDEMPWLLLPWAQDFLPE